MTTLYTAPNDVAVVTVVCHDVAGNLADPQTLVATVTPPTGSPLSFAWPGTGITRASLGTFSFEVPTTMAGEWLGIVNATGAATPATKKFLLPVRA